MTRLLILGALGATACGAGPGQGCKPDDEPSLDVGLGLDAYSALSDGDEVPFVYGPQGGYHLELGLEATHIDADDLIAGTFEGRVYGELVATAKPWLTFRCNDETKSQQSWGTLLIFDAEPAELHDVDAEITVEITDLSGATLTASVTVHILDPEAR